MTNVARNETSKPRRPRMIFGVEWLLFHNLDLESEIRQYCSVVQSLERKHFCCCSPWWRGRLIFTTDTRGEMSFVQSDSICSVWLMRTARSRQNKQLLLKRLQKRRSLLVAFAASWNLFSFWHSLLLSPQSFETRRHDKEQEVMEADTPSLKGCEEQHHEGSFQLQFYGREAHWCDEESFFVCLKNNLINKSVE